MSALSFAVRWLGVRRIPVGERYPAWYGRAYPDYLSDGTWVAPIPLNWVLGWVWVADCRLKSGPRAAPVSSAYRRGYQDGYRAGFEQGVREGR